LTVDVDWTPRALKQLKKLRDKPVQARILGATAELARFPNVANVKALTDHDYGYRLRVGNYRVFFNVLGTVSIVSIEEVRKRDERTY
jgi:mRNA-degrading endonuclease RelE of RelBE toxin-antitoxin system